jgi:hypothetical protein
MSNTEITVTAWKSWASIDRPGFDMFDEDKVVGGFGGFFKDGKTWAAYENHMPEPWRPYLRALRDDIRARRIREGGDWHQEHPNGCPVFSDGKVGMFSYRGWGDLMAATWCEPDGKPYHYMDFYMSCLVDRTAAGAP